MPSLIINHVVFLRGKEGGKEGGRVGGLTFSLLYIWVVETLYMYVHNFLDYLLLYITQTILCVCFSSFLQTLHSVCQIADALIALQQVGNVKYTGWTLRLPCMRDCVNELQQTAREMNGELKQWEQTVEDARNKFYELNYFTTVQLLDLRRELGKLKEAPSSSLKPPDIGPGVLSLLHSVSPKVDVASVRSRVQLCMSRAEESEAMAVEQEPHTTAATNADAGSTDRDMDRLALETCDDAGEQEEGEASNTSLDVSGDQPLSSAQPTLNYDDLNDEQKKIYFNIAESRVFSEKLVLMALSRGCEDEEECLDWCNNNEAKFPAEDASSVHTVMYDDDDMESLSSDDDGEKNENESVASDHFASHNSESVT